LPAVALADLPPEAQHTVSLIDQGGPFPYSRDGIVFENRERILPRKGSGYYHEYTVITPGSNDRGARRIITGQDGEMYYTDDHYESFREIVR
jgi:ribonuclease T1